MTTNELKDTLTKVRDSLDDNIHEIIGILGSTDEELTEEVMARYHVSWLINNFYTIEAHIEGR